MTTMELDTNNQLDIAKDTKKMRFSPSVTKKTPWAEMIKKMWLVTFVDFCYGWSLWVFLTWLPSNFEQG